MILTHEPEPDALAFAFSEGRMLVHSDLRVPEVAALGQPLRASAVPIRLGVLRDRACYAIAIEDQPSRDGDLAPMGLRELLARVDDAAVVAMAARASQILDWWFGHAFCGRCGTATVPHAVEMARTCPGCSALHFPRINPAVITLVHRRDEILMAHDRRFRPGFFALLAGFVEPGETLEDAVAREVREEVGVEVEGIRYFGSQSWPFPSQLMVGFFARYRTGEIAVQESEISEAHWFSVDRMPSPDDRPATFSIAGRLIEAFLEQHAADRR